MTEKQTTKMLKPSDVAERLNVSTRTLSNWRANGTGPEFINLTDDNSKPTIRYNKSSFDAWVKKQTSL